MSVVLLLVACAHVASEAGKPRPRARQRPSEGPPPAEPGTVRLDPGAPLPPLPPVSGLPPLHVVRVPEGRAQPGTQFNPDPGASGLATPAPEPPLFTTWTGEDLVASAPIPTAQGDLYRAQIEPAPAATPTVPFGTDPLPPALKLPRPGVKANEYIPTNWQAPDHYSPVDPSAEYPGAELVRDRWSVGYQPWRRYSVGNPEEMPYFFPAPALWHFYRQSRLKGDVPIRGPDLFLRLTAAESLTAVEARVPVPGGEARAVPGGPDFFGGSTERFVESDFAFEADLFRGDTVFQPSDWLVHLKTVIDFNHLDFRETWREDPGAKSGAGEDTVVAPTTRNRNYFALEEAFVEKHLTNLSPNFDFSSVRIGNQHFNSDFRGFVFNDTDFGARLFGNYDSNRWQYNLALFDLREKDADSGLNTLRRRGQLGAVANLYHQDSWLPGYTTEVSVLASFDQGDPYADDNGLMVRPAQLGAARPHRVESYYLGWTGEGHLGRWNLTDALYLATGRDDFNSLSGQSEDILAGMAAVEVSYDRDWLRYKAVGFFASGDQHTRGDLATGFDSIDDDSNLAGPFSYWLHQSFNASGSGLSLKQPASLLPDVRAGAAGEGEANFVNPGLLLAGLGAEADLTPRLRAFANANYLWFDATDPIRTLLPGSVVSPNIGTDLSMGCQWRPFLISNVVLSAGCGFLLPQAGFKAMYRTLPPPERGVGVDDFLYSAILAATFTY